MSRKLTAQEEYQINGSGLFFFKTLLDPEKKLKIMEWYKNLSKDEQEFVDILRTESSDEAEFFKNGD